MKLLLHGLNFSPEEIGIGKYSGEMVADLVEQGVEVSVVTTPPYYPQWEIGESFYGYWYAREASENPDVVRCPLWVPARVNGVKRIVHLASFGLSSIPVVVWKAISKRPDVIMVVEPAMFCLPTSLLAARLCEAKAWLHVQDFEVDAAFELGILKQPLLKKLVLLLEAFLMRRFDRVTSISTNMIERAKQKGVCESVLGLFPNWVDCDVMKPLPNRRELRAGFGLPTDKCIALYAGNIGAKQGLEIIIETAKRSQNRSDLHFVICGHGAAFPSIEEAARGLSNLQMLPVQPMGLFNQLMNSADIHLLPQRADAADLVMPSKLTGMLATGIPVVACASEGTQIAKVVEGCGLVVPPGDVDCFHTAILNLADDANTREVAGRAGRDYAVAHLGKRAILDNLVGELRVLSGALEHSDSRKGHPVRAFEKYKLKALILWLLVTLSLAVFVILKPRPDTADLGFMPGFLVGWLDENYDLRTYFLSLGIAVVPALLLSDAGDKSLRRSLLLSIAIVLVALEFTQFWLPLRRFSVPDVLYSVAGCITAEVVSLLWTWLRSSKPLVEPQV